MLSSQFYSHDTRVSYLGRNRIELVGVRLCCLPLGPPSTEIGDPYSPAMLSRYWPNTVKAAGVRHIKLDAAPYTCATLMHLQGIPIAVIAAWTRHKNASLTRSRLFERFERR